jgi:hypothetical protein
MVNPQERTRFIAGLVVGEGHFGFSLGGRRQRLILPQFIIQMSDIRTMELVIEWAEAMKLPHYIKRLKPAAHQKRETIRLEAVGINRVQQWLDVLYDELTGDKKEAARFVKEFIKSRRKKQKGAPYDEYEVQLVNMNRDFLAAGKNVHRIELFKNGRSYKIRVIPRGHTQGPAD